MLFELLVGVSGATVSPPVATAAVHWRRETCICLCSPFGGCARLLKVRVNQRDQIVFSHRPFLLAVRLRNRRRDAPRTLRFTLQKLLGRKITAHFFGNLDSCLPRFSFLFSIFGESIMNDADYAAGATTGEVEVTTRRSFLGVLRVASG